MRKIIWVLWVASVVTLLGYGIRFTYLFYTLDISLHQWRLLPFSSWLYLPMWMAAVTYLVSFVLLRRVYQ